jgi:formate dehydrogenase
MTEVTTFCRVCEPACGLIATVDEGRITSIRGDELNPLSQGFLCTKAAAMVEVTEDPDRVTTPLKRVGAPGEFVAVSWEEALDDIARRLGAVVAKHGPHAFATFFGNPPAFNAAALLWVDGFQKTIGSRWKYGVNGEDGASMVVAAALIFGSPALLPKPDLWRTQFVMMVGANPHVSHGSLITEPRVRQALQSVVGRGGRVVVVDPRHTETAKKYDHVPLIPGTDPWLLLGLLRSILDHGLEDRRFIDEHTSGYEAFADALRPFDVERCSAQCGVPLATIHDLANQLATASSAVVYGRTGTCTQRFGTLNNFLQLALNVVTGNLEVPGGSVFGWAPIDFERFARLAGMDTYDNYRTRARDLPEAMGVLPSQGFAVDIVTPGPDQIRALMTFGANPIISSGAGGAELAEALELLELHFSLDLYVNETNKYAQYILPATTFYERPDLPFAFMGNMLRPTLFATDAVVAPRGDTREEWEILNDLAARMGRGGAYSAAPLRWLAKIGLRVKPMQLIDLLIRTSSVGDWFGVRRGGLSVKKLLRDHPHGIQLREDLPTRPLRKVLRTPDKRCQLGPALILEELTLLDGHLDDPAFPMRVIGMRETRSHNTWMHNVERLVPDSRTPTALVNPSDAAAIGVADGDLVCIESLAGAIEIAALVSADVRPGTIAVPHGWGHEGGWRRANAAGGANSNLLAASGDVERLAGMSILNGIAARLSAAQRQGAPDEGISSSALT